MNKIQMQIPPEVYSLFLRFQENGCDLYVVGGAVRDYLMGKPISDWDFTTNATPEEMLSFLPDAYYNNSFGTVGVPTEGDENLKPHEITTFRHESGYSDSRHPDNLVWGKTLEGDLERRDFTINAIALSVKGQEVFLIDPFKGQEDIKKKIISAVGDPVERFREDALRMMRAVRIGAELGFKIEKQTSDAIKMHAPSIHKIAKERVRDELFKLLASPNPYEGMDEFYNLGLMDEILPELSKTFGVEQKSPGRHHIYDVGTHCMLSLKHCPSTDPIVRFATLIHDIGKPQTYKKSDKGLITFYNHEVVGSRIAKNIATRLRFSKKQTEKLFLLVRWHQFTLNEHQTDKSIRRFIKNVGLENVEDMLALRVGDRLGGGASETSWRLEEFKERLIEVQKQPFSIHDLKIKGDDIMKELNLKPGPKIGEILKSLFDKVEKKEVENEKELLIDELTKITS